MAALNFRQQATAALTGGDTNNQNEGYQNKPKAKVWLNIGLRLPMEMEDGTVEKVFVSIPVGVPIDTQEDMVARGNNAENNQKVEAGNAILKMLKDAAEDIEAGEAVPIEIDAELRRVADRGTAGTAASGASNPLLNALQSNHISLVK